MCRGAPLQLWHGALLLLSMRPRHVRVPSTRGSPLLQQRSINPRLPEYYTKMSAFADDLAASGTPLRDDEFVAYLLAGLDEEYNPIFMAFVVRADPISPGELYSQLLSFEQHTAMQLVAVPGGLPSALATSHGCGYSGGRGHGSSDRANSRGRGRGRSSCGGHSGRGSTDKSSRPQCQVCLKFGHTANQCWHRFEEDYAPEQRTAAATSSFDIDNNRYIDSGATDHITGDLDKLTMHDRYAGADQVHAANGIGMTISRIGKTIIPTPCRDLVLKDVLHVPSTHKNLILVHRFTLDNDTFIEFHPYFFLIKDRKTRKVLQHGPCKGGLYPLPLSSSKYCKLIFSAIKLSIAIWHIRLGHPARDIVRHVMSTNNLPGFICFALNMRFSNTSLSFSALLSASLITRFLRFNLIGAESMKNLIPSFTTLALLKRCLVLILISKMVMPSGNIATLWRWVFLFSLMPLCP
jgi:hypothetical protein